MKWPLSFTSVGRGGGAPTPPPPEVNETGHFIYFSPRSGRALGAWNLRRRVASSFALGVLASAALASLCRSFLAGTRLLGVPLASLGSGSQSDRPTGVPSSIPHAVFGVGSFGSVLAFWPCAWITLWDLLSFSPPRPSRGARFWIFRPPPFLRFYHNYRILSIPRNFRDFGTCGSVFAWNTICCGSHQNEQTFGY